jgi:hypothetical protein
MPPVEPEDLLPLCGVRVARYLQRYTHANHEAFLDLLRFIRVWAKSRFVYDQRFGYLSGISLQLLCAFVAIENATEPASSLIPRFFEFCASINWDSEIIELEPPSGRILFPWEGDVMRLLTPRFPTQNTLYKCTREIMMVIQREFEIGLEKVRAGRAWPAFVEPPEVLLEGCTAAIKVQFWSPRGSTADEFKSWKDAVLSRVSAMLASLLNKTGHAGTPLPIVFQTPGENGFEHCACFFIGIRLRKDQTVYTVLSPEDRKSIFAIESKERCGIAVRVLRAAAFQSFITSTRILVAKI